MPPNTQKPLHPRSIARHLREAYLDFDHTMRRIEAVRMWMPHELRSNSPVLSELYTRADKAIRYMVRNGLVVWPRE